jgi:hypothetical protein
MRKELFVEIESSSNLPNERLTQSIIGDLLGDWNYEPVYFNHSTIQYKLHGEDSLKPLANFYGVMNPKNGPYFFKRRIGYDDLVASHSDGTDPFDDFYCIKSNKKIHLQYLNDFEDFLFTFYRR